MITYKTGEVPKVGDVVKTEGTVGSVDTLNCSIRVDYDEHNEQWIYCGHASLVSRAEPPCVTFEEALAAYRQGRRIRRKAWAEGVFAFVPKWDGVRRLDVLENDWQIID